MSSGDLDVEHDNEGNKQITVKLIAWFYSFGSKTAEQNFQLDNIPRKGSFEVQPRCVYKEEKLVDIYYKPNKPIKAVQYSILKNGLYSNWNNIEVIKGDWKTGATFRIKNLNVNTEYSIKVRIDTFGNGLYRESDELKIKTFDIPHLIKSSIPTKMEFYDNPRIEIYNPLERDVWLVIDLIFEEGGVAPIIFEKITGNAFQGFDEDTIWDNLLRFSSLIPNGFDCSIGLSKSSETSEMYDKSIIHFEYNKVRGPSFHDFEYRDINSDITKITKNNQIIIKGLSELEVFISLENSMYPHDYALDSYYNFRCDTNFVDRVDSHKAPGEITSGILGKIMHAGEKLIEVTAYDSRKLGMTVQKVINVYDYNKPILYLDAVRKNKFENETALNIKGIFDLLNINNKNINTIKSIKYRYKEINGEFNTWSNINFSIKNNEYTANKIILNLENTNEYVIEVIVEDNFKETKESINVVSGISIFSIRTNGKCYIKEDEIVTKDQNGNISANSFNGAWNKRYAEDADSVTNSKWDNVELRRHLPSLGFLSNWNGAYDDLNRSELVYCKRGKILAMPRIVFWNTNGDNSDTINFDENIKDAKRIDIYFKDTSNNWLSTSMINPIGKDVMLQAVSCSGGRNSMKYSSTVYRINEDKMFVVDKGVSYSTGGYWKNNELYVYEVDVWNKYYLEQED